MPKVFITQEQRDKAQVTRFLRKQIAADGKNGAKLAREMGIPHQTMNYRISSGNITLVQFMDLCRHLEFELSDIKKLLGLREG